MKPAISIIFGVIFFSCNAHRSEKIVPAKDSVITRPDSGTANRDIHYAWSSDWQGKKGLIMKRTEPLPDDSLTPQILVRRLNDLYPQIRISFRKISNDTIFVVIPNSYYLAHQAGSTGAEGFLAEATYNLTELKNVNFVDFAFKAGDHAEPGTYTRTDFVRK